MDFSSDAASDLTASKRILFAGVVSLVALKVVSACFHNYQLYEVDRLVQHIAHSAEMERRRRSQARCAATPMLHASQPSASASPTQGGGTTAVTPRRSSSVRNGDPSALPEASMVGQKMVEDGAWQDMSAHSHDISTAPLNAALDEDALPAPVPLPTPPTTTTNAVDTHGGTCRASVDSATSSQPLLRNTSGICITAVHLVGGEPAPSTSQLLSRLSFAGPRSVASPSPAAAHARGDAGAASSASSPSVSPRDDFSPSTEIGAAFSVVHVDTAECSAPRDAAAVPSASVTEVVRDADTTASASCVVHEVEVGSGFADGATGPPVIIYAPVETAATSDSTEGLLLHAPNAPPAVDPNVSVTAASTHEKLSPCVAAEEAEGEDTSVASPLPYFSFTTTSVHIAKADVTSSSAIESTANTEGAEESVNRTEEGITSSAVPGAAAAAAATSSHLAASSTSNYVSNPAGLSGAAVYVPALSPLLCDAVAVESTGRSASVVSAATTTAASAAAPLSRPMVHLFIQPRWALAPSLSPSCTKWETFLRLHHVSYTVHEVHVLRGDQPQAQSSDVPQQIQHEVERRRKAGAGDDDAAAAEARAFADALAEVTVTQRVWGRLEAGLRRVLPAGVLPGDRRTQYALPFVMVGGAVLQGSFADVAAELTRRGLIRPSLASSPTAPAQQNGADEGSRHCSSTHASASYTPEEQRAIGQAVERTAEYTLRLLYEVGLLLEGCAVFSHYAAQLWSGHRYWDVLQIRRWFVYAWLALPFLSALKEDVQRGLRAHELGGLTREQLYRSLQSDLVSLEQLLVASADTTGASDPDAAASAVHFLLGREPGPQDCALYAYLLPILRLTPSDIAHIRNPNFTYIYESSIFRAFVQHMTAAAFPDLDVLLRPPRKPSFVVSLSAVVYDHVEARTTPLLVEVHRQLHRLVASAGRWLTPCHAAFLRCVSAVLASTPAQQARCTLRRLAHRCQGLVPVRPTPANRQPTASTSRRQCTQAWWHFLDFSKTSRQSGAGERDDLTFSGEETSVATQRAGNNDGGGSSGSTVLPRAILDSVRVNDGREDAAVGGSPVTTSAPLVVARRRSYVDSGTQVTESLEDLAALARGVQVGEETREEEDAVRVPSPVPTPAALPKEEEGVAEAQQLSVSEKFGETGMMRSGGVAEEEKSVAKSPPQLLRATDVEPPNEIAGDAAAAVGVVSLRDLSAVVVVETPALQLVEEAHEAKPSVEPAMGLLPMPPLLQQQHESTPSPAPVSPRVVHELVAAPANTHTAAAAHGNDTSGDSPLTSTRSEDNTDVIAASSSSIASSPTVARTEGSRIARSATATSAPSPRAATAGSPAATSHDAVPPRFTVDRVSAARTISRSLASPVEPRHPLAEAERRPSPGPRLRSSSTAEARPTTAKAGDSGNTGNAVSSPVAVAALRVPRGQAVTAAAAAATGASPSSIASVEEDDASETSSITTAETASERRLSYTRSTSIARSSTAATHTPTRQRRPSGLSPGLFTTVVNRKVYLTDGREHPSWSVEPRRRSSSATASVTETRAGRSSPTPSSRRGSLVDGGAAVGGRDGARSPVPSGSVGRTVTPIRKTRPSPAGRPTA